MKKSLLTYAVKKMMKQDEWANQYNPNHQFDINQYDYETKSEYLNALRNEWQWDADPYDEFEEYVDVSKYNDYDSYENDIEKCKEKNSWKEEYDSMDDFDVNPYDFKCEDDYLSALRKEWKQEYDSFNEFIFINPCDYDSASDYKDAIDEAEEHKSFIDEYPNHFFNTNPYDFENKADYINTLITEAEQKCDTSYLFKDINREDYNSISDYKKAIAKVKEQRSWKKLFDSNNFYNVNPYNFENSDDYIDALHFELKEKWRNTFDPNNLYKNVNPHDYDDINEYEKAIKKVKKKVKSKL